MDETGNPDYQLAYIVTFINRSSVSVEIEFFDYVLEVFPHGFLRSSPTIVEDELGQSKLRCTVAEYPSLEVMQVVLDILLGLS